MAMKYIQRTWHCEDCNNYFKSIEADPVCPTCAAKAQPPAPPARSDLPAPAIMSPSTKQRDGITDGLMKEFGMTNMRDGQREGDISAMPLTAAQQQMAKGFWGAPATSSIAGMLSQHGGGVNSGVPKDIAMKTVQNLARRLEGHR